MSDLARLALAGAREYVVRATRTTDPIAGERAQKIVTLIDRALVEMRPEPAPVPAAEEPWEFPEPKILKE